MNNKTKSSKFVTRPKGKAWQSKDLLLRVSVGYRNYEGARLEAIFRWLSKQKSNFITILISDRLLAYNIQSDSNSDFTSSVSEAIKKGYSWEARNSSSFDFLRSKSHAKVRKLYWKEFFEGVPSSQEMADAREKILLLRSKLDYLSHSNYEFHLSLVQDIDRFIGTRGHLISDDKMGDLKISSMQYLIEEIAVHSVLLSLYPNNAHVYAGGQLNSEKYLETNDETYTFHSFRPGYFTSLRIETKPTD